MLFFVGREGISSLEDDFGVLMREAEGDGDGGLVSGVDEAEAVGSSYSPRFESPIAYRTGSVCRAGVDIGDGVGDSMGRGVVVAPVSSASGAVSGMALQPATATKSRRRARAVLRAASICSASEQTR